MTKFRKLVSFVTAVLLGLNQLCAVPPRAWAAFPSEVKIPAGGFQLSLPPDLGIIQALVSGDGPTIIHLQNAHGNYEAQKKIQAILHYLREHYGIKILFLEGSASRLNPELLAFAPGDKSRNLQIADSLAKKSLVKGAELFLLEAPDAAAYGIENIQDYISNGKAFEGVVTQQEKTRVFLSAMNLQIERLSSPYLNKNLRAFLKRLDDFEAKKVVPLLDWLDYLKFHAKERLGIDLSDPLYQMDWPMLLRFFKLKEFESKINRNAFAKEKPQFLAAIQSAPEEIRQQIEGLLSAPLSQNQLPDPETGLLFERMLSSVPESFNFKAYPNVELFIGHLILQSELKSDRLFDEMDHLAGNISQTLAQTKEEKKLLGLFKDHRILKKLFALEMTPGDYELFLKRGERIRPKNLIPQFLDINRSKRVRDGQFSHMEEIESLFEKAREFYWWAKKRDQTMIQNVESRLRETEQNKIVVITGGFHSGPFNDYFKNKGYNYALIAPKITDIGGKEAYVQEILTKGFNFLETATLEAPYLSDPFFLPQGGAAGVGIHTRIPDRTSGRDDGSSNVSASRPQRSEVRSPGRAADTSVPSIDSIIKAETPKRQVELTADFIRSVLGSSTQLQILVDDQQDAAPLTITGNTRNRVIAVSSEKSSAIELLFEVMAVALEDTGSEYYHKQYRFEDKAWDRLKQLLGRLVGSDQSALDWLMERSTTVSKPLVNELVRETLRSFIKELRESSDQGAAIDVLVVLLGARYEMVRQDAAYVLGLAGKKVTDSHQKGKAVDALIAAGSAETKRGNSTSGYAYYGIVSGLKELGDSKAISVLIRILGGIGHLSIDFNRDGSWTIGLSILDGIAHTLKLFGRESVESLLAVLTDPISSVGMRWRAFHVLHDLLDAKGITAETIDSMTSVAAGFLTSEHPALRVSAAQTLLYMTDRKQYRSSIAAAVKENLQEFFFGDNGIDGPAVEYTSDQYLVFEERYVLIVRAFKLIESQKWNEVVAWENGGSYNACALPALIMKIRDLKRSKAPLESVLKVLEIMVDKFKKTEALVPYLVDALQYPHPKVRLAALKALEKHAEGNVGQIVDGLISALTSSPPDNSIDWNLRNVEAKVRSKAVELLGDVRDEKAIVALIDAIQSESKRGSYQSLAVYSSIAWALGNFDDRRAIQALIDMCRLEFFSGDTNKNWRDHNKHGICIYIIAALLNFGLNAVDLLANALNSNDGRASFVVTHMFGPKLRTDTTITSLVALLGNENAALRAAAATVLPTIVDPGGVEAVVAALRTHLNAAGSGEADDLSVENYKEILGRYRQDTPGPSGDSVPAADAQPISTSARSEMRKEMPREVVETATNHLSHALQNLILGPLDGIFPLRLRDVYGRAGVEQILTELLGRTPAAASSPNLGLRQPVVKRGIVDSSQFRVWLESIASEKGRVILDSRWLDALIDKSPSALYILLAGLKKMGENRGASEPLIAISGGKKSLQELREEIGQALQRRDSGLSAEEKLKLGRDLLPALEQVISVVPTEELFVYVQNHNYGVAALLSPDGKSGLLGNLPIGAHFFSDPKTIPPQDLPAIALLVLALLPAAALVWGVDDAVKQAGILARKVPEIIPGAQKTELGFSIQLREFITAVLVQAHLVARSA